MGIVLVAATAALGWQLRTDTRRDATTQVADVAAAVAQAPDVRDGLADPATADRAGIQQHVEDVRRATGVYFITVMDRDKVRWTHPDPSRIGQTFVGNADAALAGGEVVETYTGTLGPSVRAVLPVRGPDGTVVGAVAAGVATGSVTRRSWTGCPSSCWPWPWPSRCPSSAAGRCRGGCAAAPTASNRPT